MHYFRLAAPHYGERFEAYSFNNKKFTDFCLENGLGVIVFNNPNSATIADFEKSSFHDISYGQILSFCKYNSFHGDPIDYHEMETRSVYPYIQEQTDWHNSIVPPHSDFLPMEVRKHINLYLNIITDEMRVPKVAMKVDPARTKQGQPSRILTLNYCVDDFKGKEEEAKGFIEGVSWFLPPTMSVSLLQSAEVLKRVESDDSPFIPIEAHEEYL